MKKRKLDIVALNEVLPIPRWDETAVKFSAAHVWCTQLYVGLGGLMAEQHRQLIRACGGTPPKTELIAKLMDASESALADAFGITEKGKYPNPTRYELKDSEAVLKLIRKIRSDEKMAFKTQTSKEDQDQYDSKGKRTRHPTKKKAAAATAKGKKKTTKKSAAKTSTQKKTKKKAGKKKTSKKTAASGKGPRKGALGPIGGAKDWAAFDALLGARFKLNPDAKLNGKAKQNVADIVKKDHKNNVKLETLVEQVGRGTAYMVVNQGVIVKK